MTDETACLILEHLQTLRAGIDVLREDMREVKTGLGFLEQQAAFHSTRFDRLEGRLDRIEARLGLVDA
jgi:hypothetical protein